MSAPVTITRSEASILKLARYLMGQGTIDQVSPLLHETIPRPPCLSKSLVALLEDTLAKGCVLFLAKSGGADSATHLRQGEPYPGRVWNRIPLEERPLHFTNAPLEFLLWLHSEPVHTVPSMWDVKPELLSPADELFFLMAFEQLKADGAVFQTLRYKQVFTRNVFCRVASPGSFTADDQPMPPLDKSFEGTRLTIWESLQNWLAVKWINTERDKHHVEDWALLRRRGRAETRTVEAFLEAVERHNRRDLARFLLHTAHTILLTPDITRVFWAGGLKDPAPPRLQERLDVIRLAMVIPGAVQTFQSWNQASQRVGYFDEGYAASQWWKTEWVQWEGVKLWEVANRLLSELQPLGAS